MWHQRALFSPLRLLSELFPGAAELYERVAANREQWTKVSHKFTIRGLPSNNSLDFLDQEYELLQSQGALTSDDQCLNGCLDDAEGGRCQWWRWPSRCSLMFYLVKQEMRSAINRLENKGFKMDLSQMNGSEWASSGGFALQVAEVYRSGKEEAFMFFYLFFLIFRLCCKSEVH